MEPIDAFFDGAVAARKDLGDLFVGHLIDVPIDHQLYGFFAEFSGDLVHQDAGICGGFEKRLIGDLLEKQHSTMTAQQVEAVVGAGAIKIMEWFVDGFFLETLVKRSKHVLHRVFCKIGIAEYSKASKVDDFKIAAEMFLFDRHVVALRVLSLWVIHSS